MASAAEIANELQSTKSWRDAGNMATGIGAAILAALPGGGVASVIVDKLGARLFDADLEPKFSRLCHLVAALQPQIDQISDLGERVAAISATVALNGSLVNELKGIVEGLQPRAEAVFDIHTDGGQQSFVDVTIENMAVFARAYSGGVNHFHRVQTSGGDVHFHSSRGGEQRVSQSVFRGPNGSVSMDRVAVSGHVETRNSNGSAGIALGAGGMIGLSEGGMIGFGPSQPQRQIITLLTIPYTKLRPDG